MNKSCANCRYYVAKSNHDNDGGNCRRYPPVDHIFPFVLANVWCGEWKARPLANDRLRLSSIGTLDGTT